VQEASTEKMAIEWGEKLTEKALEETPVRKWIRMFALIAIALTGLLSIGAATAPVALETTEFGSGPTIVLVHGLGSSRLSWMPTARKLLAGPRVIIVELPGP